MRWIIQPGAAGVHPGRGEVVPHQPGQAGLGTSSVFLYEHARWVHSAKQINCAMKVLGMVLATGTAMDTWTIQSIPTILSS